MKTLMIYQSTSGYTERYAIWLAKETGIVAKSLRDVKKQDFEEYDVIVYGAGVYAGRIAKLGKLKSWVKKWPGKQFVVWANGSAPVNEETVARVKQFNMQGELADVPLFYGRSGMDFGKMKPLHRLLLNQMAKTAAQKDPSELNVDEQGILDAQKAATNYCDETFLAPLVSYLQTL